MKSFHEYYIYIKKKKRLYLLSLLPPAPSPFCSAEGNEAKFVATDLNMTIRQFLFP